MSGPVLVAELVRNGFVEGRHYGSVVALAADGSVDWSVGDVTHAMFPRSCSKPLQAVGMLGAGLELDGELLALACASHSGEPFHLDGVRRILAGVGLAEDALQTPAGWPLDDLARDDMVREGGSATPVAMNCSGKHAAMLATCVANGWPLSSYLAPDHPVQRAIARAVESLTGTGVERTGVDGCGAPLLSTTLVGLASAFRALARAEEGQARQVAEAMREFPDWVSGSRRDEAGLLGALPGAIAKAGAEGCYAVALPDGRAVALKIADGAARARPVVMAAALAAQGVSGDPGVDTDALAAIGRHTVLGGTRPVGELRAVLPV